jgi:hypothetical protein
MPEDNLFALFNISQQVIDGLWQFESICSEFCYIFGMFVETEKQEKADALVKSCTVETKRERK